MSAQPSQYGAGGGKKAVHVKWAGKTIALGTFPAAEADEKCARAKALTRAWRSTMRPKPSREWVMLELERLQVRVVSGRLGRKGADGEDDDDKMVDHHKKAGMPPITDPTLLRRDSLLSGRRDSLIGSRRDSITGLLSAADMTSGSVNRNNSLGFGLGDGLGDLMAQRRSSSLGLSLLPDADIKRRNSSMNLSSVLDGDGPRRQLVGGGAAAAYEAARADHYSSMAQKARSDQERRASGLGSLGGGQMGLSVNPNQHYEMLKLHHMNLLNEIQETTLMMNLYQQQQLQQQQQQLSHHDGGSSDQMALLLQQQGMGGQGRMGSLGLGGGGNSASAASGDMQALLRQQQQMLAGGSIGGNGNNGQGQGKPDQNGSGTTEDEASLQQRLQALKDDIARHQKEAEEIASKAQAAALESDKRKADKAGTKVEEPDQKRTKTDDDGDSSS